MATRAATRQRIVVIGGGYAGAYCAQKLERLLSREEAEITLIDRNNYFLIYPLLVEAGTGSLEPRHTVVSIRSFLNRAEFKMLSVERIGAGSRRIYCRIEESGQDVVIEYDHLVIALGSVTRMAPVPGLKEHGLEMKSLADAVGLRDRAIRMLETAATTADPAARRAILHLVVIGANFTGAEVAGEMEAFLRGAIRQYPTLSRQDVSVTLIERSGRILGALDESLALFATRKMRSRGIDVRLNQSATAIDDGGVTLTTGERLAARTVVWAAGIEPPPILATSGLPRDDRGYLICERDLRVKGFDNVWGVGDCAVNADESGRAYPATAQHGMREGIHAARNIARVLRGRPATPCNIVSQGSLAALGCRTGVATIFGIKFSGFAAWWLWRTVYLMKMPGLARKVRIAMDWTIELLFKRDYVQLGVHRLGRHQDR